MGGGAWPFLVGGVICLVNSVNERDLNLLTGRLNGNVQELNTAAVRIIHRITQSVGATGGVYKGQGRNQRELMTRIY